jgi:hypothetical protein
VTHLAAQFGRIGAVPERGTGDAMGGLHDPLADHPDLVAAARTTCVRPVAERQRVRWHLAAVGAHTRRTGYAAL